MPPRPTRQHVMNRTVSQVRVVGDHRLWLRFDDGAEGELDLRTYVPFDNLFAAFEDPEFVARVTLNEEWGTIEWPNGVEFDAVVLYCTVTGAPLPTFEEPAAKARSSRASRPRKRTRSATGKGSARPTGRRPARSRKGRGRARGGG